MRLPTRSKKDLEIEALKARLAEAEDTLRAIHEGEVDAVVVSSPGGDRVYTLAGAEISYRLILQTMNEGALTLSPDGTILYCNQQFSQMLKTPMEKLIGSSLFSLVVPQDQAVIASLFKVTTGENIRLEIRLKGRDGALLPVNFSTSRLHSEAVETIIIVVTDLTDRKLAEEALRRSNEELEIKVTQRTVELRDSEQRWVTTLISIGDAVISTDTESRITFMNPAAEKLTGWKLSEAALKPVNEVFRIINEVTRVAVEDPVAKVLAGSSPIGFANDSLLVRKDGTEVPVENSGAPIVTTNGRISGVVLVFRDVADRRQAEKTIKASLNHKETLLKEIHHRIKNNLSMVQALLSLQASHMSPERAAQSLKEAQNRIKSIALVHEKLYRSADVSHMNFTDYLHSLTETLMDTYQAQDRRITLQIQAQDVYLDIDTALPVSLIVNELVTNALRHAFPKNRRGFVTIQLNRVNSQVELAVTDDGVGMPEGLDPDKIDTLGLKLVSSLAGQLRGKMSFHHEKGTCARLYFTLIG
jgi:PAS domain S-box-containing protein